MVLNLSKKNPVIRSALKTKLFFKGFGKLSYTKTVWNPLIAKM